MKRLQRFRQRLKSNWVKLRIRYLLPGKLTVLPPTLTIELTNRCSLACSCCPNGRDRQRCRQPHTLTAADFHRLLEHIDIPVSRVFLHLHGEPFLNKELPVIVSMLIERGISEFSIFSNAYHIDLNVLEELLQAAGNSKLNIAFSGELYNRQTYEQIRCPGHFDSVWPSLEQIDGIMARHGQQYSVNAIIDAQAIDTLKDTIPGIFQHFSQLKDIHFSSAFPWPHLPETGDIAGHLSPRRSICSQLWELPVILASGEVSMCSSDYRGECIVGSLYEHKYSELINNKAARNFRRNIALRRAAQNSICRECLIDRHLPFSRTVKRKFIEKADNELLAKYFAKYHQYFDLEHGQI